MEKVGANYLVVKKPTLEEVNGFLNIPEIYQEIAFDDTPEIIVFRDLETMEYWGLYLYGALVGIIMFEVREFSREIHMAMLKKARKWARLFATYVLNKKIEGPVFANVPSNKRSVINLCKRVGFVPLHTEHGFVQVGGEQIPKELLCRS